MSAVTPIPSEQLASLEPSFRAEGSGAGSFRLDGQRVELWLEPEGWITGSLPVVGAPAELLRTQSTIIGLAKIVSGPSLQAEMPLRKEIETSVAGVRGALEHGLDVLEGRTSPISMEATGVEEATAALAECLASHPWEWTREAERFVLRVESGASPQTITIEVAQGHAIFRSELVALREPEPVRQRALAHFLLALNARLRLARGSLLDDRVTLEAIIPAAGLSAWLIEKALGSLIVGARLSKGACAALLDADVAQTYCTFHEEGR